MSTRKATAMAGYNCALQSEGDVMDMFWTRDYTEQMHKAQQIAETD